MGKVLSIAGFDTSGGAGIQADLKTFTTLGVYGMTVLTAIPIQNTTGVRHTYSLPIEIIRDQLVCLFDDITPDVIKIGMLHSHAVIELVATFLRPYEIPIVLDPVVCATSSDLLLEPGAIHTLKSELLPQTTLVTPNLPEGKALTGLSDVEAMAEDLLNLKAYAVLIKGGHALGAESNDLYKDDKTTTWLKSRRIPTLNTHGTGCTLSAAIAAYLTQGHTLLESCRKGKEYISKAIDLSKDHQIGQGAGPLLHHHCLG